MGAGVDVREGWLSGRVFHRKGLSMQRLLLLKGMDVLCGVSNF